ncbi:hypothetical protein [Streptomyces sp. NRRL F-2747]|uniref:hypothetical protein n=1 Tax=Streptomyces sp. NRRL F-2747 TaxID=1463843 RepID=UPI00131DCB4C|nr:hypothetical protein [Streptomyces sp. NRRL F-2747]
MQQRVAGELIDASESCVAAPSVFGALELDVGARRVLESRFLFLGRGQGCFCAAQFTAQIGNQRP